MFSWRLGIENNFVQKSRNRRIGLKKYDGLHRRKSGGGNAFWPKCDGTLCDDHD